MATTQLTNKPPAMAKYSFDVNDTTINVFHVDKAGDGHPKHIHDYNHVTIVHAGKLLARTEKNGEFEITKETGPLLFPGNEWHELEALEDNTVFSNVFGIQQEGQRDVIDM